jgi:hypothetical protein
MFRDRGTMQAAGLAVELGFGIACPMLACIAGGFWADQQLNTEPLLVLAGIFGGLVLAFGAIYNLTKAPLSGRRKSAPPGSPAPAGERPPDTPTVRLAGPPQETGRLQTRLNNAIDDLLARLERVGSAEDLAQARLLRQALAPERPDLDRLIAIQSYFAAQPTPARDAADHFFSDPVVTEILNTVQ